MDVKEEDVTGENSSEPSSSTGAAVAPGQSTSHHQVKTQLELRN